MNNCLARYFSYLLRFYTDTCFILVWCCCLLPHTWWDCEPFRALSDVSSPLQYPAMVCLHCRQSVSDGFGHFLTSFSPFLVSGELKRFKTFLQTRLCVTDCCIWLNLPSYRHKLILFPSNSCVHWRKTFNFLQEFCIHNWLLGARTLLSSLSHVSTCLPHYTESFTTFCLKLEISF